MSVRDNYGGQWVKQFTNFVRKMSLSGIQRAELLRRCYLNLGLKTNKTKEFLADLEELNLIKENDDGKIYWIDENIEPLEELKPVTKEHKRKQKKEQRELKKMTPKEILEAHGIDETQYLDETTEAEKQQRELDKNSQGENLKKP